MHPNAQTLQRFYTAFSQLDHATMAACYAPDPTFEDEAFSLKGREQIGGMWRMLCTADEKPGAAEHWKLEFSGIEAMPTAAGALGGALPFQRYRPHGTQHHRRHLHLHTRRADRHPPRPLQLLALVTPGPGPAGRCCWAGRRRSSAGYAARRRGT